MSTSKRREKQVQVRMTPDEKSKVERAADLCYMSRAAYMRTVLLTDADRKIRERADTDEEAANVSA